MLQNQISLYPLEQKVFIGSNMMDMIVGFLKTKNQYLVLCMTFEIFIYFTLVSYMISSMSYIIYMEDIAQKKNLIFYQHLNHLT